MLCPCLRILPSGNDCLSPEPRSPSIYSPVHRQGGFPRQHYVLVHAKRIRLLTYASFLPSRIPNPFLVTITIPFLPYSPLGVS